MLESHLLRLYFLAKANTILLECVFVRSATNQVPLWSGITGNRLVALDACEAGSAEALERHTIVLGGHIVPLC